MTTKPKPRKAPAAETGINPKLTALAARLDEAQAHYSQQMILPAIERGDDTIAKASEPLSIRRQTREIGRHEPGGNEAKGALARYRV